MARVPAPARVRYRARRAAWAAVLLLAACAGLPAPPAPDAASRGYGGRFSLVIGSALDSAVDSAADSAAEPVNADTRRNWSGRFSLVIARHTLRLDLVSPLGNTLARFESPLAPRPGAPPDDAQGAAAGEARLVVPEGGGLREVRGANAEALALDVLGWSLPIDGLPDWVEGHPSASRPFRRLTGQDDAERFEQDGWLVTVEAAAAGGAGRRLRMEHARDGSTPAVALRVILDAGGGS